MTGIEWTNQTWNPTTGCDRVSPGCDHCYALVMARRLKAMGQPKYQTDGNPATSGAGFGLATHAGELARPYRWREPQRVFINSMSDLFHPAVPRKFITMVLNVVAATPRHTYQVLTKRPHRMRQVMTQVADLTPPSHSPDGRTDRHGACGVLPNLWLGTSIETSRYAHRADHLRHTPAAIRFLSLEPLLGPLPSIDLARIDWVIVGGESGPSARPAHPDWVRDIRNQCVAAGVAFFFKQWGGRNPKHNGRHLDGRTWDQFPTAHNQPAADDAS